MNKKTRYESGPGAASAVAAYLIWGFSPIYWKALQTVPAFEILMHRMLWSCVFLVPLLLITGRWGEFAAAVTDRRKLGVLLATTLIVACNWFLFIWAITSNHILQTSLGYFITPLVNIFLGMIILGERLRRLQVAAVILAGISVIYLTFLAGEFPWVALSLAFTFGFYGLIRKVIAVGPLVGLAAESLGLTFFALPYLIYLDHIGAGHFLRVNISTDLLLMGAVLVTAPPLLFFHWGAKRLHLTTVGFLQYLAPSCSFLVALILYHEPLSPARLHAFGLIWTALGLYSLDSYFHRPNRRHSARILSRS